VKRAAFFNLLYQTTRCSFLAQKRNSAPEMLWHPLSPLAHMVVLGRKYLLYGQPLTLSEIGWAFIGPVIALALGWQLFKLTRSRIPDCI